MEHAIYGSQQDLWQDLWIVQCEGRLAAQLCLQIGREKSSANSLSRSVADRQIERLMNAAGGATEFLEKNAVIVCSDHAQVLVEDRIDLMPALSEFHVATPSASKKRSPAILNWPAVSRWCARN